MGLLGFAASKTDRALGAEQATGFYLLGFKGSMAGFVPPPGTYITDFKYHYTGSAAGAAAVGVALQRVGRITVEAAVKVDAQVYYDIPAAVWVAPHKLLGGNLGLSVAVPIGWKEVDVDLNVLATLTLPPPIGTTLQAGRRFHIEDDWLAFGDPVLSALIGWHEGNWHWNVGAMVNMPVGAWERGRLANIGFNRAALDANAAVTWLDPKIGFETSAAAGFTFNGLNSDTDYQTGTEFHLEFAVMQHFSKDFAIGLAGYHYQQVTGDSGAGARLGDFKGRVTALGPALNWNVEFQRIPVSTTLKWQKEFDVENRLEGEAALLTLTMPLSAVGG
jgi:hypothetical protein